PVVRETCRTLLRRLDEAETRLPRLLERFPPRAVELHELGAVHQAPPRESNEPRLLGAPPRERVRPFTRATHLEHLLAREDDAAVDEPCDDRGEIAARHRDHRLVEQPEAALDVTAANQELALGMDRKCEQIGVVEAARDLDRF